MDIVRVLFAFIIFPGFVFTAAAGLLATWLDRKVTARLQWRVGPPLAQPVYDFLKLLGKETIVPAAGSPRLFLAAPLLGLSAVTLVSTILWLANIAGRSFVGDLIVVAYLLVVPSLTLMLGGMASANPLASQGAGREMKLVLAYELPFLACLAVVIVKNGLSLRLAEIAAFPAAASVSGALAFFISLLCVQAKLGFVPFDIAEAETEIMGGPYIEYSGPPLAVFRLSQAMLLLTLPVFLATLYLGGLHFAGLQILTSCLKIVLVLVLIIVIKNTNPRLRIDQALKFFWRGMFPLGALALGLALLGRVYGIPWL